MESSIHRFTLVTALLTTAACSSTAAPSSPPPPSLEDAGAAGDRYTQLAAHLPELYTTDPVTTSSLKSEFPNLTEIEIVTFLNAVKALEIKKNVEWNTYRSLVIPRLGACSCDASPLSRRVVLVLSLLNDVVGQITDRNAPYVHTVFAEGRFLQSYLFGLGFSNLGFTQVTLNIISPGGFGIEDFAPYVTTVASLPAITKVTHYASGDEYIRAVDAGRAERSHSYDITDTGVIHPADSKEPTGFLYFGERRSVNEDLLISDHSQYNYITLYSHLTDNFAPDGPRAPTEPKEITDRYREYAFVRIGISNEDKPKAYCEFSPVYRNLNSVYFMYPSIYFDDALPGKGRDSLRNFCDNVVLTAQRSTSNAEAFRAIVSLGQEFAARRRSPGSSKKDPFRGIHLTVGRNAGIDFESTVEQTRTQQRSPLIYVTSTSAFKYEGRFFGP